MGRTNRIAPDFLLLPAAVALVTAALPVARAAAEPATLVFKVDASRLPSATQTRLTAALHAAPDPAGLSPRSADVSASEAAVLLECSAAELSCLEKMTQTMEAGGLLFAAVRPGKRRTLAVRVTYFAGRGAPRTLDLELPAAADVAAAGLEKKTRELLSPAVAEEERAAPAVPAATEADEPIAEPIAAVESAPAAPSGGGFHAGRVRPYAWGMAVAGVALLGAGTVVAIGANDLRDQVEEAPRDTVEDFERLAELEDDGKLRTGISTGLLIGGGVVLVAGAVLIVKQGLSDPDTDRGPVTVAPALHRDGIGFVLEVEVP